MQVFGSGRKQDFAMCLGGSELQTSQQEENPQLHILMPCSHLSDGVINNAFESFKSALSCEVGYMESSPGASVLK